MDYINLNYAATSAKKPKNSTSAMINYLSSNNAQSPSRGGEGSLEANRIELYARLSLCSLFNVKKPEHIIFTPNVTTSLNMIINGLYLPNCHVLTTSIEHNAVARPLEYLKQKGEIELDYIPCNLDGTIDPNIVEGYIKDNTRFIVMTHASNVTGTILDYESIAKIAKDKNIFFILDVAQSAGILNIDFDNSNIDVLAFTGHKSLMGPSGTGGFIVKNEVINEIKPFITGGTGSKSHLLTQPDFLPDKFESGTPNLLGILGLKESVDFILDIGLSNIYAHDLALTKAFLEGIGGLPVDIYGSTDLTLRTPAVSFNPRSMDCSMLSSILYEDYKIITRPGLHCAPLCHKTIGTYPEGTIRFSFGYFTTIDEIAFCLDALNKILKN